ncbi:MAG: hypothetical protein LQ352_000655 [Teloschistes flavicans]|nr:MAG: hypothetical protein LQ352_000655 [Teloschistes flavicans]
MAASAIVSDAKPMVWMFIDNPPDGVTMLLWQPLAKLGIEFASDGYVWADAEQAFSSQVKGYTVEMYLHRSGYRPQSGERMTTHQRRRYRLMPGHVPNPGVPPADPSLWIVHYSQAEPNHQIPINQVPQTSFANNTLTARKYLQQFGQLVRKEFMLHDRSGWPTINLPGNNMGTQHSAYPNNVISHMNRQQQGYAQPVLPASNQAGIGPPAAKRQRQTPSNATHSEVAALQPPALHNQTTIEDEEDVSRGDILDFLTPRDISAMRFKQHHEWLGEVFRSPYDTHQIVPGELGLGRKGELEALTKDFFNAPTTPSARTANGEPPARVGRLEAGRAEDFTALANNRIAEINAEIEKMKKQHSKRMAKIAKGADLREAEKLLRTAGMSGEDVHVSNGRESNIATVQSDVEGKLGKRVINIKEAECVQKGGLLDTINESEDISQNGNFSDHAADLSGQIPAFDTPHDQFSSIGNSPGMSGEPATNADTVPETVPSIGDAGAMDVAMGGMQDEPSVKEGEADDWILVNKEGEDSKAGPSEALPDLDAFTNDAAMGSNVGTPGDNLGSVVEDLAEFSAVAEGGLGTEFEANDFSEGVDFGNLDTAGEALSAFGGEENMGLEEHVDLGLDDSAFGEAFHSTEADAGREA